jgi:mono/diheme cytochrome c family protein
MISKWIAFPALAVVAAIAFPFSSEAQQRTADGKGQRFDFGKVEYESKCASCHGLSGKGDGPAARSLTTRPSDLSKLAASNGGVLLVNAMYSTIVGDKNIPAHGPSNMPVWGSIYTREALGHHFETPQDNEAFVRGRILFLVEYINRLQVK